jgi:hypothetical protein
MTTNETFALSVETRDFDRSDVEETTGNSDRPIGGEASGAGFEDALSPADIAFAADLVRRMETNGADDVDEDSAPAGQYRPAPPQLGEFRVRLSQLGEWVHHPRKGSRHHGDHASALALTAANPDDFCPLVVLPAIGGVFPIVDGRFRWQAIQKVQAGRNVDVEVRCILFNGTEAEAVTSICDESLGSIVMSDIERAQALLNLQRVACISQRAIAERYPRMTESKVSNMLIAARTREQYPVLFEVLEQPDRAPINYGVDINKLSKTLAVEDFQSMLDRANDLIQLGELLCPSDAFVALRVERPSSSSMRSPLSKPLKAISAEMIFGHDDLPVGIYERLQDGFDRIRLPDAASMSLMERETAAEALTRQIYLHLGIEIRN